MEHAQGINGLWITLFRKLLQVRQDQAELWVSEQAMEATLCHWTIWTVKEPDIVDH